MTHFQIHTHKYPSKNEKTTETYTHYRKIVIPNWSMKMDHRVPDLNLEQAQG
jgi:hypothetical protein